MEACKRVRSRSASPNASTRRPAAIGIYTYLSPQATGPRPRAPASEPPSDAVRAASDADLSSDSADFRRLKGFGSHRGRRGQRGKSIQDKDVHAFRPSGEGQATSDAVPDRLHGLPATDSSPHLRLDFPRPAATIALEPRRGESRRPGPLKRNRRADPEVPGNRGPDPGLPTGDVVSGVTGHHEYPFA